MKSNARHGRLPCVTAYSASPHNPSRSRTRVTTSHCRACADRRAARRHQSVEFPAGDGKERRRRPGGRRARHGGEIAKRLGVPVKYVTFKSPGELADAAEASAWDIGLIGAEPQRAEKIAFTPAYVEIEATYLVPAGSPLKSIADVDKAGVRIAVTGRAAYGLWLDRNIKNAELVRSDTLASATEQFVRDKLEALAGLRPGCCRMSRNCRARAFSTASSWPCSRPSVRRARTRPAPPSCAISSSRPRHRGSSGASSKRTRCAVCPSRRRADRCRQIQIGQRDKGKRHVQCGRDRDPAGRGKPRAWLPAQRAAARLERRRTSSRTCPGWRRPTTIPPQDKLIVQLHP